MSNHDDQPSDGTSPSQDSSQAQNLPDVMRRPSLVSSRTMSDAGRRTSQQYHVRFSTDLDQPADEQPQSQSTTADRRPSSRGLTIDTGLAPPSARHPAHSPTSPLSPPNAAQGATLSPISPTSPDSAGGRSRSRNRGYSLRRSIFTKTIQTQSEDQDDLSALELGEVKGPMHPGHGAAAFNAVDAPSPVEENNELAVAPTATLEYESTKEEASTYPSSGSDRPLKDYYMSFAQNNWTKKKAATAVIVARVETVKTAVRKFILRIKDIPPTKDGRHIDLNPSLVETLVDERTGKAYCANWIRSSRYSFWSFFPRQLFAQFTKLANFYFLVVAILQMIPGLSTTGTFTTLIPLLIFVGISMGKEGFDDWRRYRLDKEENNRYAWVLRPGQRPVTDGATIMAGVSIHDWVEIKWQDIRVGDVIKLERDQPVPADFALLHANGPNGVAYIETMALDGETNLKNKQPCQPVAKVCSTVDDIISNALHFVVEDPNLDLYKFDGHVTVNAQEKLPLTNNEIVYRGSILRNTDRAIGMVIYTGEECKIRMNANKNPRIKKPSLQAKVNRVVMLIVLLVVTLAVACTLAYKYWFQGVERDSWYLTDANVSYGPIFTSFLIMFNTMIPISLYVSMEIVKVAQMLLLNDIDMYDPETNTPLEARTSTINEELGQVSYIFSDKTGTLTNNSMRFRKMSVAGTAWLHDHDLQEEAAREGEKLIHKKRNLKGKKAVSRKSNVSEARMGAARLSNVSAGADQLRRYARSAPCRTTEMLEYIQRKPYTVFARKAKLLILAMALCHTCIPEEDKNGHLSFQAASPDELALVMAAQELGYLVMDRQSNSLTIRTYSNGTEGSAVDETYEVMDVIEFSSARKRMSVVVRMPDQRICLFCKGADTTLMRLLKKAELAHEKATEIERRVSKRKAAEANQVIRRNSEYQSRRDSGVRNSLSRPSFTRRRSSVSGHHVSTLRDSIDVWLRDRETDGGILNREDDSAYYSPRSSVQMGRTSTAISDSGSSANGDEDEDLVEEALVVNEAAIFERCFQHLNDFATDGLRTLLYGHRFLDETTYKSWKAAYHDACTSLVDRQQKIEQVGEELETQLELTGATAIEDKLQKGVPEAIDKLRRANIKLWMLTGDKRETAINVGHSCRLVKEYSTLTILDHENGDVEQTIVQLTADLTHKKVAHSVVVVDGQTLSEIEADDVVREQFFQLAIRVDSVICCRASPKQKAFLVKTIRKHVNDSITLAIGDGANDIAMIQEAHVGIGITGKEGLQAARISDYSIAQFRFLLKLLLVHGRWNYMRVCKYTLGTFWKEMLFYLTQALYQRWNGYTGTSLYEPWSLSMFNTLFTSLAVIFLGIFTKDLSASTLLAVPELYTRGQQNGGFNIRLYLGWTFMATCEAMIIFFTMYGLFGMVKINFTDTDTFALGLLTFSACIIAINIKLQLLEVYNKTYLSLAVIIISVGGWFLWDIILSERYKMSSGKGVYAVPGNFLHHTGDNLLFWLVLLISVAAVLLFELTVSTLRALFFPTDVDIFQEYEQDLDIRKRFEEAAAAELQQGWDHGTKKSSFELAREAAELAEMDARERHVQELLSRPRVMSDSKPIAHETEMEGYTSVSATASHSGSEAVDRSASVVAADAGHAEPMSPTESCAPRRSVEIHELFSRGFGSIRKGQLK
ncbi:phospholipid-transporting ATPase DNF3 [Penicillium canariense]|uniref:Phospholipid-transporting ATPase n=1 Tax=Penicillium canariense TaxID=189055 RepID=A0A9W9IAI8_9EURO|nr:phospholipid-transporting ATPase DNF3 [Penicillium canariense]KAJ5168922.1 phospholipid-transporting ATPase DNF3 [Penicillium canariense]